MFILYALTAYRNLSVIRSPFFCFAGGLIQWGIDLRRSRIIDSRQLILPPGTDALYTNRLDHVVILIMMIFIVEKKLPGVKVQLSG